METALQRIAALAGTDISNSAIRLIIVLTSQREGAHSRGSLKDLQRATQLSKNTLMAAIAELESRGLICADRGSSTRAGRFRLCYLEVAPLPGVPLERGPEFAPPSVQNLHLGGAKFEPPLSQNLDLGGAKFEPHPRAREIDSIDVNPIDRLLRANPKRCDAEALAHWRSWLHGYQSKLGREPNPHPPDDRIVAQWMACGEHHQLERLLYDLMAERKQPGNSYGWFIAVALQRIHGISPEQQHKQRAQLRAVPKQQPPPPEAAAPAGQQGLLNSAVDLQVQIAQLSQRKAMR